MGIFYSLKGSIPTRYGDLNALMSKFTSVLPSFNGFHRFSPVQSCSFLNKRPLVKLPFWATSQEAGCLCIPYSQYGRSYSAALVLH